MLPCVCSLLDHCSDVRGAFEHLCASYAAFFPKHMPGDVESFANYDTNFKVAPSLTATSLQLPLPGLTFRFDSS